MEFDLEVASENFLHHLGFASTQETVVDENAGELVPDGTVNERCGHARIDAAAQSEDHALVADLRLDFGHSLLDVIVHRPVTSTAANVMDEIADQFGAPRCMDDFGMELQAKHRFGAVFDGG